ncbi:hypothetical protein BDZ97DRAFT_1871447 [Flammula alnicola]|nr:hypothetical protein BDZ97DRAFT_1871447 [Flammula alnicola]
MKFLIVYALLGFLTAVTAIPSQSIEGTNDISRRDSWNDDSLAERFYADEDSLQERDNLYDDDSLGARYLDPFYELSEREYEEIEARQVPLLQDQVNKDKDMRSRWTKALADNFRAGHPHLNFVVCHTQHTYNFKGTRGVDWDHSHQELNVSFHQTVGYEIYWFKEGTFHRIGDGGYLNWAYTGNVQSTSNGGKDLVFGPM